MYEKERYHYLNYIGKFDGAKIKVLPTETYETESYTPFKSALDILKEPPGKVEMDDFSDGELARMGGVGRASRVFGKDRLGGLIQELNVRVGG